MIFLSVISGLPNVVWVSTVSFAPLNVICKWTPLLVLLASLFNDPHRFVLVGDLNFGHVNWHILCCSDFWEFFDSKIVLECLVSQHIRASTDIDLMPPPSLLGFCFMDDDSGVLPIQLAHRIGLSDRSIFQIEVNHWLCVANWIQLIISIVRLIWST